MPSRAVAGCLVFILAIAIGAVSRAADPNPPSATPPAAPSADAPAPPATKPAPTTAAPAPKAAKPAPSARKPAPGDERVDAVMASLRRSAGSLHQYEWTETIVVSVKGEEKSRKENRCHYGPTGKVERNDVSAVPVVGGKSPRGARGRTLGNSQQDITPAMKEAVGLAMMYVPLDPARIQAARDAGRVKVKSSGGQGKAHVVISDYLKEGDSVVVDLEASHLAGLAVSTFTDKEKQAVSLTVDLATLPDGTTYPSRTLLDAREEGVSVVVSSSGHKKVPPPD